LSIINKPVEIFIREIQDITDDDYGDFMRKANAHVLELKHEIIVYLNPSIESVLQTIQNYLQFNPIWEIQPTRERLISDARIIDELLAAEKQDWESWVS
jgi:hypothetical protein